MADSEMTGGRYVWHRELTRYHWFVLAVAGLGWLFDTMDQQLFNLARVPAMRELLAPSPGAVPNPANIAEYGGYATSIFLIGWAAGGLFFGVLGDRIGRARTMLLTILVYSLCTGLSAISTGFWDFALFRFLTGLGVGGEFAVGVSLVAEVMPSRARPLRPRLAAGPVNRRQRDGRLDQHRPRQHGRARALPSLFGFDMSAWRVMFLVGTVPALLAIVIRSRLKEPERWQEAAVHVDPRHRLGSYSELLGDSQLRRRAIIGLLLATSGVIGLWGIAFFSIDLGRSVFRKEFERELREQGSASLDRDLIRLLVRDPAALDSWGAGVRPVSLINASAELTDAQPMMTSILGLKEDGQAITTDSVLQRLDQTHPAPSTAVQQPAAAEASRSARQQHWADYLAGEPTETDGQQLASRIAARANTVDGRLNQWIGLLSMTLNIGGFFGIYCFGLVTEQIGRRRAFALAFLIAWVTTLLVFWSMDGLLDVFWMIPLMGFGVLSPFGGYAIYFPELFPTRLRSTGTSFCYNVGRFLAAIGPSALGLLTGYVFRGTEEPLRWAGITMCSIFAVGLLTLPFAPETKGQPLPE